MLTTLRKFTVIFLAILQFIAPLVHAHAGEKVPGFGLHVHGLEMHNDDHDDHDDHAFQAVSHDLSSEGIVVGVAAGMKDKQVNMLADRDNSHYLHQQTLVFNAAISPFDTNFSPQATQFVCRLFIPSLSPRAPPAQ
ncbi:MAG: hypothetical protein Q7T40_02815 [Methylobacter sp.]|nr:hypothetical protein [Methylobacter sp.]